MARRVALVFAVLSSTLVLSAGAAYAQYAPDPSGVSGTSTSATPTSTSSLPVTGAQTAGMVLLAVLLVAAGTTFVVISRRRADAS